MTRAGPLLDEAARRLKGSGSSSPRLDAELLLAATLGVSRESVLAHPEREVAEGQESAFQSLLRRREAAEPMAYLLGVREFYGREFRVDRRALIPRPETELLVELGSAAVDRWRARGLEPRVLEVGTGAGAVAISLALERRVRVFATDISPDAVALAVENACHHHARVSFVAADLLTGIRGPLQVVLANLPYVPNARDLPPDVKGYEPHVAIFGGERGTELIERLLAQCADRLAPDGEVCVELDEEEQATPVAALARELYGEVQVLQDAGGYDRVVRACQPR